MEYLRLLERLRGMTVSESAAYTLFAIAKTFRSLDKGDRNFKK